MSSEEHRLFWGLDGYAKSGGYGSGRASVTSKQQQASGSNAAAAPGADAPHAIKLIDVSKGKLILAKSGVELLRSLPATSPLNLLFIFGNARSGKSFLMNCLSGCPGL